MYLLDTNVVSELRRPKPHGAVVAWLTSIPNEQLYMSAVTLGKLRAGVEITREQDEEKADTIEAWIDDVETVWNILPMDGSTFRVWARLMHGNADRLIEDAMIAATALVNGLTVATRNVRDFERFAVQTLNPFTHR